MCKFLGRLIICISRIRVFSSSVCHAVCTTIIRRSIHTVAMVQLNKSQHACFQKIRKTLPGMFCMSAAAITRKCEEQLLRGKYKTCAKSIRRYNGLLTSREYLLAGRKACLDRFVLPRPACLPTKVHWMASSYYSETKLLLGCAITLCGAWIYLEAYLAWPWRCINIQMMSPVSL